MRTSLRAVLCGVLAAALVLCVAESPARDVPTAHASEDDPTILLSSIAVGITVDAPAFDHPDLPTYVHLGYGMAQPKAFDPETGDVVFYDQLIYPSSQSQTFEANVADDPRAAALADDIMVSPPLGWRTFFVYQVTPGTVAGYGDLAMHIPPGAQISYFKMTVAPFTIEKRIVDPFHVSGSIGIPPQPNFIIQPYSVYRMITDGPVAVIEAWGPPPPGDATCDAQANSIDALIMLQRSAGLLETLSCEKAADVNADGSIDSLDAQLILQFVAGLIPVL